MVRVTAYVHQPEYNYNHRYKNLTLLSEDVKRFLLEYDQIILHKDLYRGIFHIQLREVREKVKELLRKFDAAPYDDGRAKNEKELFCCKLRFDDTVDLRRHYRAVHNEPFVRFANVLELKSSLAKLTHMRHRLTNYITYGEEKTLTLITNLKRMLTKISATLKF
ncbi:hypothetical protein pipiens_001861 [Culex pipiens pipiens]|uniref:C2H2-type domain-containing protein n=1 Tax=Culex pipiens pipiens TaxID=38569 RepID=A0ABD1DVM1_CULPP